MASTHLFGIRHHGPGSARSVARALDEVQPDVVLVELPADTQSVLGLVGRDDLVPPVALLGHVLDRPDVAVFLPFAVFSPEWVAMRWAATHGVPVRALDLPLAQSLAWREAALFDPTADDVDPLGELARAAGALDAESWWEDVVEHRGEGRNAFAAVAEAMTAVRDGRPVRDFDAVREAHMRTVLRDACRDADDVAVVCGAWHVPALADPLPPVAADKALLRGLAKVKVACTWVPWTHRRLAAGQGYGAGVRAPGWYAHVFRHPGEPGLVRWFVEAGTALRTAGFHTSPEHLIAGVRTAQTLATLRDRPRAGLDEALDAAVCVMGEGRTGPLALLRDKVVIGPAIGSVPDDMPMVPLARDLSLQQKRCRLAPSADDRTIEIDLRQDRARARSHLLHRLVALGIGWGTVVEGRGSSGSFRETWRLSWEPEMSVQLVERSAYGTTVAAAATARLVESGRAATSVHALVGLVESALLGDLADAVPVLVARLGAVAAHAPDLADLMDAVVPLARTSRYGDVRGTDLISIRELVDSLVVRVLAGLDVACRSLDDDGARVMAQRLTAVQGALALLDHPERHTGWPRALERLAVRGMTPLVAGRAARVLHDSGTWTTRNVADLLARHVGRGAPPAVGAAFVEGFLSGGGTVLVHDDALLGLLDDWVAGLDAEAFGLAMPLLRRTFGSFEPAERRRIGELLSGTTQRQARLAAHDLDPARVEVAMVTLRALLGAR